MDSHDTHLLTLCSQMIHRLTDGFRHRSHGNDHSLGCRIAIIVEQSIFAAGNGSQLLKILLNNVGHRIIKRIRCFTCLEINIIILCCSSCYGRIRRQSPVTETLQCFLVDERCQLLSRQCFYLLNFVGCAESIEEMKEWYTAFNGTEMSYCSHIHHLLHGACGKEGEP